MNLLYGTLFEPHTEEYTRKCFMLSSVLVLDCVWVEGSYFVNCCIPPNNKHFIFFAPWPPFTQHYPHWQKSVQLPYTKYQLPHPPGTHLCMTLPSDALLLVLRDGARYWTRPPRQRFLLFVVHFVRSLTALITLYFEEQMMNHASLNS